MACRHTPGALALVLFVAFLPHLDVAPAPADDWPEMQGRGRRSVWNETGILRQFPAEGLTVRWRAPIGPGYSGPAVAGGRVFVTDYDKRDGGGAERVVCLDEQTGRVLWVYENPEAAYDTFTYNNGPRATPTVDDDRVYVLGAAGDLYCLDAQAGDLRWKLNIPARFEAPVPTWGFAGAPLVYGDLLISPAGGPENARLVALNKMTGDEVWRALPVPSNIGYSPPVLIAAGGVDQLIHLVPGELASLNPQSGDIYWRVPFEEDPPVATPVVDGDRLLISGFHKGSCMIRLAADEPAAEELWRGPGTDEFAPEGLNALMCTPAIKDGYVYGVSSYGQFRCLDAATGAQVWETLEVVGENARWANAFIVRNHDVFFINNDRGELIIADLAPTGYRELARTHLIKPTSPGAGARTLGMVNWVIPAYANCHLITRNDEEIIRVSLEG
jgi:outer membrane protein assembly factor BamB